MIGTSDRGRTFAPKVAEGCRRCASPLSSPPVTSSVSAGAVRYYPSDWDTGDKEQNVELADKMNEKLGVSPIQRQSYGSGQYVWLGCPRCRPRQNEEDYRPQMGGMTP